MDGNDNKAGIKKEALQVAQQLKLDQQVALLSGVSNWYTAEIEGSVPAIKVTDGPVGARGDSEPTVSSVCLPCTAAQAASFNRDLIYELGCLLGKETVRKGARVLLAPTVNLARHPLGGRNFENFGEDPVLTANMAAALVQGIQSQGVAACAKHLVANDVEWNRLRVSAEVDEQTLRELYLYPFEVLVESGVMAVMSAYPKLNGTYCSENYWLLTELLRNEWGFDGLVMSDWGGTQSLKSLGAGQDLEMPGPPRILGSDLLEAVENTQIDPSLVLDRAANIIALALRTGGLQQSPQPEQSFNLTSEAALVRRGAIEGMVLLKNHAESLPLKLDGSLALIGPNADPGVAQGGGSAALASHYEISPLAGLGEALGQELLSYAPGCLIHRYLPSPPASLYNGLIRLEVFSNPDFEGTPTVIEVDKIGKSAMEPVPVGVDKRTFSCRWQTRIKVAEAGEHLFSVFATGPSRVFIDGELLIDNWNDRKPGFAIFNMASSEVVAATNFEAGQVVNLVVEWSEKVEQLVNGLSFGYMSPFDADAMLATAVETAAAASAAVIVVGLNSSWETEGHDRTCYELPGRQNELVEKVAAVQPNTVVVINAGSPVAMPWLEKVSAVLMAWYPGQEFGHALAEVLLGKAEPGGRLPISFPYQISDASSAKTVPVVDVPPDPNEIDPKLHYSERLFIGYRGYDEIEPMFAFGHGLGYTSFDYQEPELMGQLENLDASVLGTTLSLQTAVTNNGKRAGKCVLQVYSQPLAGTIDGQPRPRVLAGFNCLSLEPGETRKVMVALANRCFHYWDGAWRRVSGSHSLQLASSASNVIHEINVEIP